MTMLVIIGVLFVLAIVSPFVFPNKMVSDDPDDIKG